MPLYEYECRQCGEHFERRQSMHEEPVQSCPDCGGVVRRVIFPVGIIFKGSGFYVTDSRRPQPIGDSNGSKATDNGSKAAEKGNGSASADGAASTNDSTKSEKSEKSTGSESKPASSAEPVASTAK